MRSVKDIIDQLGFLSEHFEINMLGAKDAGDKEEFARHASTFALCEELLEWIKTDG